METDYSRIRLPRPLEFPPNNAPTSDSQVRRGTKIKMLINSRGESIGTEEWVTSRVRLFLQATLESLTNIDWSAVGKACLSFLKFLALLAAIVKGIEVFMKP